MKAQIISDIHTDGGRLRRNVPIGTQLNQLLVHGPEVCILAGDMSNNDKDKIEILETLSAAYKDVVVVLGNHDCWFKDFPPTSMAEDIRAVGKNIHLLENSFVELGGTRIHGGTLWFKKTALSKSIQRAFADFRFIPNAHEVYDAFDNTVAYLRNYVRKGDIVVTHHTPSLKSVPEQYKHDPYTCFFSNDLDWLVKQIQPKIWIHGHTHDHFDYMIDSTRIICNPYGYEDEITDYKPVIIDL